MRKIDITGQKFGRLTAVAPCPHRPKYWTFKCDCGRYVEMRKNSVTGGQVKSCGCSRRKKHNKKTWEDFVDYAKRITPSDKARVFLGTDFFTINNITLTKDLRVLIDADEIVILDNYSDMIKLLKIVKEN